MDKENIKQKILMIIKDQCDGTHSPDIENWNIASPDEAPQLLFEFLSELIDNM